MFTHHLLELICRIRIKSRHRLVEYPYRWIVHKRSYDHHLLAHTVGIADHLSVQAVLHSSGEGRKITVTLTSDMSATEIGNTLQEKGLVRDGRLFALQYLLSEYKKDWKPGTYELSTAMTAEEMMEVMAGQTESATEETVETIDNGSAITGETQDTTAVAQ